MDNMEYIDGYFKSAPSDEQKQQFEQRVINDISFAEEVAFYISANGLIQQQLQDEKKQRFREIYAQRKVMPIAKQPVKKIWRYMAAASLVAAVILLTWFLSGEKSSPQQLADQYIQRNFKTLSVTMGGNQDSLQTGLILFNNGKLTAALKQFETIANNDPANDAAKKYAGIVSLRMEYYGKALTYFSLIASNTSLYSNPGKFYKAIALLKRNENGDKEAAKSLLREVVEKDLDGKEEAVKWLKKLE